MVWWLANTLTPMPSATQLSGFCYRLVQGEILSSVPWDGGACLFSETNAHFFVSVLTTTPCLMFHNISYLRVGFRRWSQRSRSTAAAKRICWWVKSCGFWLYVYPHFIYVFNIVLMFPYTLDMSSYIHMCASNDVISIIVVPGSECVFPSSVLARALHEQSWAAAGTARRVQKWSAQPGPIWTEMK